MNVLASCAKNEEIERRLKRIVIHSQRGVYMEEVS
jgi:hypothetical protein